MPGGCIPWVQLQCIPGCIPGAFWGAPPGVSPVHTQVHSRFICTATKEHGVLPPNNSETSQDPERLYPPFLEAFPWEVQT